MKKHELEKALRKDPSARVLFVSSPEGDRFEFAPPGELEADLQEDAEITTAQDLLDRLDFETYEDQDIDVRI